MQVHVTNWEEAIFDSKVPDLNSMYFNDPR